MYCVTFNQKAKCIIDSFSKQVDGQIAKGNNLISRENKITKLLLHPNLQMIKLHLESEYRFWTSGEDGIVRVP